MKIAKTVAMMKNIWYNENNTGVFRVCTNITIAKELYYEIWLF
ncbi:MAG: hypothetical protein ACI4JQ_00830 [Ruminococcus sp.]